MPVLAAPDASEALRLSEERYRTLVAATSGFVWSARPDGMVEDIPGWRELTGQTVAEVRGRGWLDAIHPDDRARVAAVWGEADRTGTLYRVEYRVQRKEGGWCHLDVRGVPVRNPDGSIREWIGTCNPIDERKRAESALRESEERFRNMADNAPVILWVTDADGVTTYLNAPWKAYTGMAPEDAHGHGWLAALHPDDRGRVQAEFLKVNAARGPWRIEYRLRRHDGAYRWMMASASPRFGAGGEYLGYVGSVLDIEDRRRAEEVLRQEKERLEQLDAERSRFLNMVAHELHTPMTPILLQLHLLRQDRLPDAAAARLDILDRNLQRLSSLVRQLLDASRLEAGRLPMARARLDLAQVAREVVEMYQPAARKAGVALELAEEGPAVAEGDAERLLQVAINLVSNALKFTPAGGTVRVAVRGGAAAELEVADTGAGLDPEQAAALFQPFARVHRTAQPGTGLGLYISRAIAEAHGGTVEAASEGTGRGARFTLRLPAAATPPPATGRGPAP